MKKFRDYFLKAYNENTGYSLEGPPVCVSNIDTPFAMAKADGVKTLEVSKWEYTCLARFYQVPWNWSGKTIWRIRLVIKEPENEMDKLTRQFIEKSLIDDIFDDPKPINYTRKTNLTK